MNRSEAQVHVCYPCTFTIRSCLQDAGKASFEIAVLMCISTLILMGLISLAEKSSNPERNLTNVEVFAARLDVLDYDSAAAAHTGQLRAELAKAGRQIGTCDQMIAGHAWSRGLIIVTNNCREFDHVTGVRVVDWVAEGDAGD